MTDQSITATEARVRAALHRLAESHRDVLVELLAEAPDATVYVEPLDEAWIH